MTTKYFVLHGFKHFKLQFLVFNTHIRLNGIKF